MKTITLIAVMTLLTCPGLFATDIYKIIDKDGNVVYTDNPSPSQPSEKVKLKPVTPLPMVIQPPLSPSNPPTESPRYNLEILRPAHEATIRNNGNFSVAVAVEPDLQSGHKLRLLIDSELKGGPQRGRVFAIANLYRGSHQLTVEILDDEGNVVEQASNTVHVHRPFIKNGPSAPVPEQLKEAAKEEY